MCPAYCLSLYAGAASRIYFVISSLRARRTAQAIIVHVKSENLIIFSLFSRCPKLNCLRSFGLVAGFLRWPATRVLRIPILLYSIPVWLQLPAELRCRRALFTPMPTEMAAHCQIASSRGNHNGKRFARKRHTHTQMLSVRVSARIRCTARTFDSFNIYNCVMCTLSGLGRKPIGHVQPWQAVVIIWFVWMCGFVGRSCSVCVCVRVCSAFRAYPTWYRFDQSTLNMLHATMHTINNIQKHNFINIGRRTFYAAF